ncbi:hypothetical protein QAD02_017007 [Eretmocerus hayati]|uniref:Uncharacterized protein n=1 Tax=Eretmocerus hayati TaxID=131215 RepID=A0ACC2PC68_9HYME|nr:hypothetical protein QAD02_017007 [Eretmocerus hayati]
MRGGSQEQPTTSNDPEVVCRGLVAPRKLFTYCSLASPGTPPASPGPSELTTMAITQTYFVLLALASSTFAAPAVPPSLLSLDQPPVTSSTFDQRQDGKLNVRVDLDNFIILFARPSSPSSSSDLFGSLSQIFSDSRNSNPSDVSNQPSEGLITSNPDKPLDDVSIVEKPKPNDESGLVLLQLPKHQTVEITGGKIGRALKGEFVRPRAQELFKVENIKNIEEVEKPQKYKLVSDEESPNAAEGCGPDRERNSQGICVEVLKLQQVGPVVPETPSEQL